MSSEGGEIDGPPERKMENTSRNDLNHDRNGKMAADYELTDGNQCPDDHDQLVQIIFDLRSQNEFLKSQLESVQNLQFPRQAAANEHEGEVSAVVKALHEKVEALNKEIFDEKETRGAAEEALKHLQMAHLEADARALELSIKLEEAQKKLDQEIKEREEKYSELDTKFSRLHKRAKQRIQDIQKEKDDLEVRFREVSETSERAVSQQATLQQELERTRQQANEALKAIDAERQQLRSANNKLRDNIEELRNSLQPKENALERMQQSLLEKDQMLEDLQNSLQAAEERRQASLAELSAKHHKSLENLEAQLADALSDRSKAGEIISGLQALVAEKETKIAEMDAASSGEAARLRAALETVKGEAAHLRHEHEKEKESLEASLQALKMKLEIGESNYIRAEIEAAKTRSLLESEISAQNRMLSAKDAELSVFKEEVKCLEKEFSSYKARAHALLQKKEAELAAAVDSEQIKILEETLEETEKELTSALAEKDQVLLDLQNALENHKKELTDRDSILIDAKNQINILESNLHSANARLQSEKEVWELNLQNVEETWRIRYDTLKAQKEASTGQDCQKELEVLKQQYLKMKEEHHSFRDLADRMIEEKDREIAKLLEDNKSLHQSLEPRLVDQSSKNADLQKQDISNFSTSAAEQQILILARQQAQREEELAQSQRHILALQEEIEELERENRLHSQQFQKVEWQINKLMSFHKKIKSSKGLARPTKFVCIMEIISCGGNHQQAMLKEEFRNMERMKKREGVDMTYLKNVVLKLLQTGEVEALLPVIGMLLQFSPEEIQKCQQAFRAATADVPPSPSSDSAGPTRSLFSRFSFT